MINTERGIFLKLNVNLLKNFYGKYLYILPFRFLDQHGGWGWEGVPLYMLIIGITLKEDQLDFIMLNHLNLFSFDTHSVTVS